MNQITSIKDIKSDEFSFSVNSVPVSDQLNVSLKAKLIGKELNISITNELGQQVKRKEVKGLSINKIAIPVTDLPNGIYYVKLSSGKSTSAKQVVKMRYFI